MTNKNSKSANFKNHPAATGYLNFDFCVLHFDFARKRAGFTLLETIVALAIIIAAVIGPVVLITSGLLSFGFSKNKLIALNLAQEGLELIRVIRENNIICDQVGSTHPWDWFRDPSLPTGNPKINEETLEIDAIVTQDLSCNPATLTYPRVSFTNNPISKLYLDADGTYNYSNGQETIFSRGIVVARPSSNENLPGGENINRNDIREITSTVRWRERGMDREMVLKEKLYNWK